MDSQSSETLNRLTIETCETLLGGLGLEAHHLSSRQVHDLGSDDRIALIGFGGEKLRGTLLLDIPSAVLVHTHPRRSDVREDLEDWVGELANLLLGRLKAALLPFDVVIQLSTPLVVKGSGTRIEQSTKHSVAHTFEANGGQFRVLLAATAEGDFSLANAPVHEAETFEDMVMF